MNHEFEFSPIPSATINAINSLKKVDTLIFGGKDRGIDYKELIKDYKPIIVVDDKRIKYYCPNGVEITFNDKDNK